MSMLTALNKWNEAMNKLHNLRMKMLTSVKIKTPKLSLPPLALWTTNLRLQN